MTRVVDIGDARRFRAGNEPWHTKKEIAELLGFSVRWVEYRVVEGMPHKVFGGRLRFQRSVVEAWLEQREEPRSA
jgi:excisionase family DNA binding protein